MSSTDLTTATPAAIQAAEWNTEQIRLVKEQIAPDLNDGELGLFVQVCKRTGLDPFAKQVYAIKRAGKMTIQTSIDGYRLVAQRSGRYNGQTPPEWYDGEKWLDVWIANEPPKAARIGVYIKGADQPTWGVASWQEYVQTTGNMWKKMPATMLAKCAESIALRKAFPAELNGILTQEEMAQADNPAAPANALGIDAITSAVNLAEQAGFNRGAAVRRVEKLTAAELPAFLEQCENRIAENNRADELEIEAAQEGSDAA